MKNLLNHAFNGTMRVPGDKSITHRSLILGTLANGRSSVKLPLRSEDTLRTMDCMRALGAKITEEDGEWIVESGGASSLTSPSAPLYTGNSGTATRLITGLVAGLGLSAEINGDASINMRPMDRVAHPLSEMGADIDLRNGVYSPITITPSELSPIVYNMPVASAQVKSAILLAGLSTNGTTEVIESAPSRNHSEIMMKQFGADVDENNGVVRITGGKDLSPKTVIVPGDISSAAFPIALAVLKKGSSITIENVSLNTSRSGILDVLEMMGADIMIEELPGEGEAIGNITASYTPDLKGFNISGSMIPRLIDEIPVLALLAAFSNEPCTVSDASELRYKETDRIRAVIDELSKFGVEFEENEDGFKIISSTVNAVEGIKVKGYHDHRIIMMLIVLSIVTDTAIDIDDISAIDVSYPGFIDDLKPLRKDA